MQKVNIPQSYEFFRTLFDSSKDAIFILKDGILIDVNPASMEIFKCQKEDLIGKSPVDVSPEFQSEGVSSMQRAKELIDLTMSGSKQRFEWLHKRLDGELFQAEVSLNKASFDGVNYLFGIIRDISDRKELERKLEERVEELEKLNKFMVNREVKMAELKEEIEELENKD